MRQVRLLLAAGILAATTAAAQNPRVEAGVQIGAIQADAFGEKPPTAGGRVTVKVFRWVDAEAEVNRFPIGGAVALFPATQVLVGARVGAHLGPIGIFGKIRPGFLRYDPNPYAPQLSTQAGLDLGGILELYSRRHVAVRIDLGDTVVWYGPVAVNSPSGGGTFLPGTKGQFQASFGISFWF